MMSHQSAAEFHNRYPYSGKIICGEHGTTFHRQVIRSGRGEKETWQCRVYRQRGRAACSIPQLCTTELDEVMAQIFNQLAQDRKAIVDAVLSVIQSVPNGHDYQRDIQRLEDESNAINAKKDRLLEISVAKAITIQEFKRRNDGFNDQLKVLEEQIEALRIDEAKNRHSVEQLNKISAVLEAELAFQNGINSALVTTILDHIVVKKESTKREIYLDVHLKFGGPWEAAFIREKSFPRFIRLKNTIPPMEIRMT